MMNRFFGFLFFGCSVLVTACSLDESNSDVSPSASVSIYALSPDAPNLNLFLNGMNIAADIPFGSYTLYSQTSPGNTTIKAQTTSDNVPVDTTVTTVEGNYYSVFLIDSVSKMKPVFLMDHLSAPATDSVRLRFLNVSPDAPAVTVYAYQYDSLPPVIAWRNRMIGENAAADSINRFVSAPAGTYNFYVLRTSNADTLASFTGKSLSTSANYTVLLEGRFLTGTDTTLQLGVRRH